MTAAAHALRLPRIRRFRKPPSRLVHAALCVVMDAMYIALTVVLAMMGHSVVLNALFSALWAGVFGLDRSLLKRYLVAYLAGRRLRPPTRWEWFRVCFFGSWVVVTLPAAVVGT
jgi:hypothetical protein